MVNAFPSRSELDGKGTSHRTFRRSRSRSRSLSLLTFFSKIMDHGGEFERHDSVGDPMYIVSEGSLMMKVLLVSFEPSHSRHWSGEPLRAVRSNSRNRSTVSGRRRFEFLYSAAI